MKLLKIKSNQGFFRNDVGDYVPIDKITKEELLRLINQTLSETVEFDEYHAKMIQNQAHQIIYQSVHTKLMELYERKDEFLDQSERLYLKDYERYKNDAPQQGTEPDA